MTYSYAILELSVVTYTEIYAKLIAAGYADQITDDGVIDMHGLAVQKEAPSDDGES